MNLGAFPNPKASDDEDVTWALSTAAALWTRGASDDALRWLRRAAETANDLRDDGRAVELYRVAAELASIVPGAPGSSPRVAGGGRASSPGSSRPPPSAVRTIARSEPQPPTSVRPSAGPPRPAASSPPPPASFARPKPASSPPPPPLGLAPKPKAPPVGDVPAPAVELLADEMVADAEPEPTAAAFAPAAGPASEPPQPLMSDAPSASPMPPPAPTLPSAAVSPSGARVMVIPTSRRGELRVVLVPAGTEPPPGTLTASLVPGAESSETIRALLFGVE